jgi:hypothetical protein
MLVDGVEGAPSGQGVVNVSPVLSALQSLSPHDVPGGKKKDGNAFCQRRWRYSGANILLHRDVHLNPPCYLGVTPFTDMTSVRRDIASDVVWFRTLSNPLYSVMCPAHHGLDNYESWVSSTLSLKGGS